DDVGRRFEAYGWHVEHLGEVADDLDALEAGLRLGIAEKERPTLLILRSHIGAPSPDLTDNPHAHGNPFTAEHVTRTKAVMGIPDEPFWAPAELVEAYRASVRERGADAAAAWHERFDASGVDRAVWDACWHATGLAGWQDALPVFDQGESIATRVAIEKAFNATIDLVPGLVAGAADLTGNTGTKLAGQDPQSAKYPAGRQVYYGVREHAMGSAMVGMALHGGVLPAGGTFFVFLDYMRPPVRLAALSRAKVVFVFTHDSVGVGEDGPTHQPVEHIATLRAIPGLQVIRPADANETMAAWRACVEHDGPTALVLSRQNLTVCTDGSAVTRGGGIVRATTEPQVVIVATGSEVPLAVTASEQLAAEGVRTQVVSLPSWDRFEVQGDEYRAAVFPPGVPVLSVEAATTFGWERYADRCIGIDRFGASAPGGVALDKLGINVDHVVSLARQMATPA
ncbi:MAG: transketolase C-terminal domain-containing protein, partial [Ilumatobacteraceae bacterium]